RLLQALHERGRRGYGLARRVLLDEQPGLDDVGDLLRGDGQHQGALLRVEPEQALGLQPQQCFAHGGAGDPDGLGQLPLGEERPTLVAALEDALLDMGVDAVGGRGLLHVGQAHADRIDTTGTHPGTRSTMRTGCRNVTAPDFSRHPHNHHPPTRVRHVRPPYRPHPQLGRTVRPFTVIGVPQLKTGIKGVRLSRAVGVALTTGAVIASGALYAAPAQAASVPTIVAKGGYVMNNGNGKSLYSKSADIRRSTGSTTKIMTAKVVLAQKNLNLDAKVTIQKAYSDYIVSRNASSARLIVGDKVTVRQLLYGLMLPSGCDAAYALADKFGSGKTRAARVKSFVGKMNADAKKLGLKNTHFDSFDGIGNGKNYSTPRDLTKIASSALKNSTFRSIVKTKKYTAK